MAELAKAEAQAEAAKSALCTEQAEHTREVLLHAVTQSRLTAAEADSARLLQYLNDLKVVIMHAVEVMAVGDDVGRLLNRAEILVQTALSPDEQPAESEKSND